MKAIMKTIKPKTCANIMSAIQSILVIKNKREATAIQKLINKYGYAEIYVYCSNEVNKNLIYFFNNDINQDTSVGEWEECYEILTNKELKNIVLTEDKNNICRKLNSKVLFKFRCYKVEEIKYSCKTYSYFIDKKEKLNVGEIQIGIMSHLNHKELNDYLKEDSGYAIHISKLEIFDKPKEISDFKRWVFYKKCSKCPYGKCENDYGLCSQCCEIKPLTEAPQNYCYVEGE